MHPLSGMGHKGPRIVFCFAGQGFIPIKAARDLCRTSVTFKQAVEELDEIIDHIFEQEGCKRSFESLVSYFEEDEIRPVFVPTFEAEDTNLLSEREELTTPPGPFVIFSAQYGLAKILNSYGLEPTDIIGYSLGEYVASTVSGSIPAEIALRVLLHRENLFNDRKLVPKKGGMLAVRAPREIVTTVLAETGDLGTAEISGFPGPQSTMLSGDADVLDHLQQNLEEHSIPHKRTDLSYGMHSTHVGQVGNILRKNPNIFPPQDAAHARVKPGIKHWSTVTGIQLPPGTPLNANYWATQLTKPIHFSQCVDAVYNDTSPDQELVYLDLGMGPRLTQPSKTVAHSPRTAEDDRVRNIACVPFRSTPSIDMTQQGWVLKSLQESLDTVATIA